MRLSVRPRGQQRQRGWQRRERGEAKRAVEAAEREAKRVVETKLIAEAHANREAKHVTLHTCYINWLHQLARQSR